MIIINSNLKFSGSLKNRKSTKYVVLHHADAKNCTVQDVHRWHLNNGWSGIGYHYFVNKNGEVFTGRPLNKIGAHCLNHNEISVGICAEGDFENETMSVKQKKAIAEVVRYIKGTYPEAVVVGHKELKATACPGKYYPLDELKNYESILNEVTEMEQLKKQIEELQNRVKQLESLTHIYKKLEDIPVYYRETIEKLLVNGDIQGTGNGELNISNYECRVLTILNRAGVI